MESLKTKKPLGGRKFFAEEKQFISGGVQTFLSKLKESVQIYWKGFRSTIVSPRLELVETISTRQPTFSEIASR